MAAFFNSCCIEMNKFAFTSINFSPFSQVNYILQEQMYNIKLHVRSCSLIHVQRLSLAKNALLICSFWHPHSWSSSILFALRFLNFCNLPHLILWIIRKVQLFLKFTWLSFSLILLLFSLAQSVSAMSLKRKFISISKVLKM